MNYKKPMENVKQQGFTLVELFITLVVAAILLAVGVPGFQTFIKNNRLVTSANALVTAANIARSEAVKRGARVTLCKSANPNNSSPACTTSGDWEQGWLVFSDENNNGSYDSTTETLIRVHGPLPSDVTMKGSSLVADYLSFVATGESRLAGGGSQSGTIKLCDDRVSADSGNYGKQVSVNAAGRISVTTGVACP